MLVVHLDKINGDGYDESVMFAPVASDGIFGRSHEWHHISDLTLHESKRLSSYIA